MKRHDKDIILELYVSHSLKTGKGKNLLIFPQILCIIYVGRCLSFVNNKIRRDWFTPSSKMITGNNCSPIRSIAKSLDTLAIVGTCDIGHISPASKYQFEVF